MDRSRRILLLSGFAGFLSIFILLPLLGPKFDLLVLRTWFSLRGPRDAPRSVTVVRLDSRSLKHLGLHSGQGPSFSDFAKVLDEISAAGPRLIIFDMLFSELANDAQSNDQFERALRNTPSVIGRALQFYLDTDIGGRQSGLIERLNPPRELAQSAKAVLPMLVSSDDSVVSGISLQDESQSIPVQDFPLLDTLQRFNESPIAAPGLYDLINFYGPSYSIPDVPIYKLLAGGESVSPEYFRDRIVFVGAVDLPASNLYGRDDSFITSVSPEPMWGVEILATITANLLDGTWIRRWSPTTERLVSGISVYILLLFLLTIAFRRALATWAAAALCWTVASYVAFVRLQYFLPGAAVVFVILPMALLLMAIHELIAIRGTLDRKH